MLLNLVSTMFLTVTARKPGSANRAGPRRAPLTMTRVRHPSSLSGVLSHPIEPIPLDLAI